MNETEISLLMDLGFTNLEAMIYIALLKEPNITGYRVSKVIGKPVPNTYKALESLQNKGAIVTDQTQKSKAYTPLPITEYLDQLEQGFHQKRKKVEKALEKIGEPDIDYGIFKLDSLEQVITRTRTMIDGAQNTIFIDSFPSPFPQIRESLQRAISEGKLVWIRSYDSYELAGAEVFCLEDEQRYTELYPGTWHNIVVDSKQYLMCFLGKKREEVVEAFWTNNPYLGLTAFNSSVQEFQVIRLIEMLLKEEPHEKMKMELARLHKLVSDNNRTKEFFSSLFKK